MNKTAVAALGFLLGAASGAAGAWYILKTRYEQMAQEEIDSVKDVFRKRCNELKEQIDPKKDDSDTETVDDPIAAETAKNIIDYSSYSTKSDKIAEVVKQDKHINSDPPYVITPEEFSEFEDYSTISLYFFRDQILTDDDYELLEDVDDVIGFESLNHFGEYEDDAVYVRNDRLKTDYEILRDERTYQEACKERAGV